MFLQFLWWAQKSVEIALAETTYYWSNTVTWALSFTACYWMLKFISSSWSMPAKSCLPWIGSWNTLPVRVGYMDSMVTFQVSTSVASWITKDSITIAPKQHSMKRERTCTWNFAGMEMICSSMTKPCKRHVRSSYSPALKINKMLAFNLMGWLRSLGNYDLRQSLHQEFCIDTVPYWETMTHNLKNDRGKHLFWLIGEDLFHLSVICDWHFTNLNKALQNVVCSTSRS